jgi:hypothetical protein
MDNQTLWSLTRQAWNALGPHFMPVLEHLAAESGLDLPTWGLLLVALTLEPETTSPARLQVRGPYTAADGYRRRLGRAAAAGYLEERPPGEYRLTKAGRTGVQRALEQARAAMTGADPLPLADSRRLAGLLDRLVHASRTAPPPPGTWSIDLSHSLMPSPEPPLPYVEQSFSCLGGYRDDAHLAAWQPSGLNAAALEALTYLWRREADSLDTLCERLAHRGHPRRAYAQALEDLRVRGFVAGPDSAAKVTEPGSRFRDWIEANTDRYFFAPWACLDGAEKEELASLLARLRDGLGGE